MLAMLNLNKYTYMPRIRTVGKGVFETYIDLNEQIATTTTTTTNWQKENKINKQNSNICFPLKIITFVFPIIFPVVALARRASAQYFHFILFWFVYSKNCSAMTIWCVCIRVCRALPSIPPSTHPPNLIISSHKCIPIYIRRHKHIPIYPHTFAIVCRVAHIKYDFPRDGKYIFSLFYVFWHVWKMCLGIYYGRWAEG